MVYGADFRCNRYELAFRSVGNGTAIWLVYRASFWFNFRRVGIPLGWSRNCHWLVYGLIFGASDTSWHSDRMVTEPGLVFETTFVTSWHSARQVTLQFGRSTYGGLINRYELAFRSDGQIVMWLLGCFFGSSFVTGWHSDRLVTKPRFGWSTGLICGTDRSGLECSGEGSD